MVQTAVLFETYIRDEYARKVFDAIKAAQPKKLYFYSNKALDDHPDDVRRNENIRSWVKEVDWDCELHTWFRDKQVDVYTSTQCATSWVFEHEEQAIILEDDCVPSLAFFDFCDKMLEKYRDNPMIWSICGNNWMEDYNPHGYDILFTKDMHFYGWASWRDRWEKINWEYDFIADYEKSGFFDAFFNTEKKRRYYKRHYADSHEFLNRTHVWDYLFVNTGWHHNAFGIYPARNLVENIGLEGSHNKQKRKEIWNAPVTYDKPTYDVVNIPPFVQEDPMVEDRIFYLSRYRYTTLKYRIIRKLHSILNI